MRRYTLTIAACLALAGVVELLVGGPGQHVDPAPVELDGATPEARRIDNERPRSRVRRKPIRRARPDRAEGRRPRGTGSANGEDAASGGGAGTFTVAAPLPAPVAESDSSDGDDRGGDD